MSELERERGEREGGRERKRKEREREGGNPHTKNVIIHYYVYTQ